LRQKEERIDDASGGGSSACGTPPETYGPFWSCGAWTGTRYESGGGIPPRDRPSGEEEPIKLEGVVRGVVGAGRRVIGTPGEA
jgi:hypothetical protein